MHGKPLWIMIAGPYGSGADTADERDANLERLNRTGLALLEQGHVPVIGVNNALPLMALAGEASFERIMMPLSKALAERCDACLRIEGASKGADEEVELFRKAGKPVFSRLEEIFDRPWMRPSSR